MRRMTMAGKKDRTPRKQDWLFGSDPNPKAAVAQKIQDYVVNKLEQHPFCFTAKKALEIGYEQGFVLENYDEAAFLDPQDGWWAQRVFKVMSRTVEDGMFKDAVDAVLEADRARKRDLRRKNAVASG